MFQRLLIVERGECAVRIARTCKRLGIATVALRLASDPDEAPHVEACDDARPMPESASELAGVVAECSADAVHPGYVEAAGFELLRSAGELEAVAIVSREEGLAASTDRQQLTEAASQAGLRMVPDEGLDRPRRLDMLAVADGRGAAAAIGEMEHMVRSDGSTVLAEAPSPALLMSAEGDAIREAMAESSGRLLRELGVTGVATLAFQLDMHGRFWLQHVRPGLPSLHAPVELVTGVDLVELQLRVATGERLDPELERLQPSGHAFLARVEASRDPKEPMGEMRWPPAPHGRLRVDPTVHVGQVPDTPLLLKMSTVAPVRHVAFLTMDRVLAATTLDPYPTNVEQLRALLANEAFRFGQYDVEYVERVAG